MKTANLTIAILYTILLSGMFVDSIAIKDMTYLVGTIMLVPPIVLNWLSFATWKD